MLTATHSAKEEDAENAAKVFEARRAMRRAWAGLGYSGSPLSSGSTSSRPLVFLAIR
jgi:hypothetical protein